MIEISYPATYLLHMHLARNEILKIGARPEEIYRAGEYYYVGSALRAAGSRLTRHWQGSVTRKWHIDYLRAVCEPRELWVFEAENLPECALATRLQSMTELRVVARFGSSDCRCPGHLWYGLLSVVSEGCLPVFRDYMRSLKAPPS